jgi:hypothetical protein
MQIELDAGGLLHEQKCVHGGFCTLKRGNLLPLRGAHSVLRQSAALFPRHRRRRRCVLTLAKRLGARAKSG